MFGFPHVNSAARPWCCTRASGHHITCLHFPESTGNKAAEAPSKLMSKEEPIWQRGSTLHDCGCWRQLMSGPHWRHRCWASACLAHEQKHSLGLAATCLAFFKRDRFQFQVLGRR